MSTSPLVLLARYTDGLGFGFSSVSAEETSFLRTDWCFYISGLPVLSEITVESHCGCRMEPKTRQEKELDPAHSNVFRDWNAVFGKQSGGHDGYSRGRRWVWSMELHILVVHVGVLVRHTRYRC